MAEYALWFLFFYTRERERERDREKIKSVLEMIGCLTYTDMRERSSTVIFSIYPSHDALLAHIFFG